MVHQSYHIGDTVVGQIDLVTDASRDPREIDHALNDGAVWLLDHFGVGGVGKICFCAQPHERKSPIVIDVCAQGVRPSNAEGYFPTQVRTGIDKNWLSYISRE